MKFQRNILMLKDIAQKVSDSGLAIMNGMRLLFSEEKEPHPRYLRKRGCRRETVRAADEMSHMAARVSQCIPYAAWCATSIPNG